MKLITSDRILERETLLMKKIVRRIAQRDTYCSGKVVSKTLPRQAT